MNAKRSSVIWKIPKLIPQWIRSNRSNLTPQNVKNDIQMIRNVNVISFDDSPKRKTAKKLQMNQREKNKRSENSTNLNGAQKSCSGITFILQIQARLDTEKKGGKEQIRIKGRNNWKIRHSIALYHYPLLSISRERSQFLSIALYYCYRSLSLSLFISLSLSILYRSLLLYIAPYISIALYYSLTLSITFLRSLTLSIALLSLSISLSLSLSLSNSLYRSQMFSIAL